MLVAAGSGERLGAAAPKALVHLGERTILAWALESLAEAGVANPVVVGPPDDLDEVRAVAEPLGVTRVVAGGSTRHASVRAGLEMLAAEAAIVAVHDAARPLVPATVTRQAIDAVVDDVVAAAPALPVADTLKRVDGGIVSTVERDGLFGVQTPQVFRVDVIRRLVGDEDVTDELGLVEAAIADGRVTGRIVLVDGSLRATKITTPDDLAFVTDLLRSKE